MPWSARNSLEMAILPHLLAVIVLITTVLGKDGPSQDHIVKDTSNKTVAIDESTLHANESQHHSPPSTEDLEIRFNCLEVSGSSVKVAEDVYELCEKEYHAVMASSTSSAHVERLFYSLTRGSLVLLQMDDFEGKSKTLKLLNTLIETVQIGLETKLNLEQKAALEDIKEMLQSAPVGDHVPSVVQSAETEDVLFYLAIASL